jgi:hypothetical protein
MWSVLNISLQEHVNTPTRRKKKTNMSGDNTMLLEKIYVNSVG